MRLTLTPENRMGIILTATMEERQIEVIPVFTRIESKGRVSKDADSQRQVTFDKLCRRLKQVGYARWWRFYSLRKEWELRFEGRITIKKFIFKIFHLRPRHARELSKAIRNSLRITYGKTTNPYE